MTPAGIATLLISILTCLVYRSWEWRIKTAKSGSVEYTKWKSNLPIYYVLICIITNILCYIFTSDGASAGVLMLLVVSNIAPIMVGIMRDTSDWNSKVQNRLHPIFSTVLSPIWRFLNKSI